MVLSLARPVDEPHDHVVSLYDDYADIHGDVVEFLVAGLLGGEAILVAATPAHRDAIDLALRERVDLELARVEGRYTSIDAAETLARFSVGGKVDPGTFRRVVGSIVADAGRDGRPIRAFGEMVALLWEAGDRWGAVDLEAMWNELGQEHRFSLFCAYPMSLLGRSGDLGAIHAVCSNHSKVAVPKSYADTDVRSWRTAEADRSELFIADPLAVRAVRRFVVGAVADVDDEFVAGGAALVASELAANVVEHVGSPFRVTVRRSADTVTIAVEDLSSKPPVRLDPSVDVISGRGVTIIEAMCTRWGTDVGPTGKVVWAELARQ